MSAALTIWNPIKVYKALRWDMAITAEDYLKASVSVFLWLFLLFLFFVIVIISLVGFSISSSFTFDLESSLQKISTPIWVLFSVLSLVFYLLFAYFNIKLMACIAKNNAFNAKFVSYFYCRFCNRATVCIN